MARQVSLEGVSGELCVSQAALPIDVTVIRNVSVDRYEMYKLSRQHQAKVPKELARLSEQTSIPIYTDGLPRPLRRCRINIS
jgi:hypothetical protein